MRHSGVIKADGKLGLLADQLLKAVECEYLRNLCWIQHKHDDNFHPIFIYTETNLKKFITNIAGMIQDLRPQDETVHCISFLYTPDLSSCLLLISRNIIQAKILVPLAEKGVEKHIADIKALQSTMVRVFATSALNDIVHYSTYSYFSDNVLTVFARVLQSNYQYEGAINDVKEEFRPLLGKKIKNSFDDINKFYHSYDRELMTAQSASLIFQL